MRRLIMVVFTALATVAALTAGPASAVNNGQLDGQDHRHVGLMVASDAAGNPLWRCSGTLLSATVFLTAGHCVEAPAAHAEIWFDADVESGIPGNGYPFAGDVGGTPYPHPDYDPERFFLRDVGIVVLDDPVELDEYAVLPELDQLDSLETRRGLQDTRFTAVGYGLQQINPVMIEAERVRMVAYPKLEMINVPGFTGDFSLLLSNNHATGGTCFGDSGGPNFMGDTNVVAGVTSFGINGNCAGGGGVFRMDRVWALDFVEGFLGL